MDNTNYTINLSGVEKRFVGLEKPAVASLTATITGGSVTGLVGPDGKNNPNPHASRITKT